MTNDELDEVRRLLVAFEDAGTWCEQLAALARDLIGAIQQNRPPNVARLSAHLTVVDETLRHLEADRRAVRAIRERVGLPPAS